MANKSKRTDGSGSNVVGQPGNGNNETGEPTGPLPEGGSVGGNDSGVTGGIDGGNGGIGSGQGINPGEVAGEPPKRKRGRPPGTKSATAAGTGAPPKVELSDTQSVKQLAGQIQGLHLVLATLTRQPVFALGADECTAMASAINNVAKHYNLDFNGPRAAVINLIAVAGGIYLPRLLHVQALKQQARQEAQATTNIPPGPGETAPPVPDGGVIDFEGAAFQRAATEAAAAARIRR